MWSLCSSGFRSCGGSGCGEDGGDGNDRDGDVGGVDICVRTGTSTRRQYPEALVQFIFRTGHRIAVAVATQHINFFFFPLL